jgi:hypothetical protein
VKPGKRRGGRSALIRGPLGILAVLGTIVGTTGAAGASSLAAPTGTSQVSQAVIVRAQPGRVVVAEATVRGVGGRVGRSLGLINGFVARVPAGSISTLGSNPAVAEVTPDSTITLDSVNPTLGYDPTGDDGSLHAIEQLVGAPRRGPTARPAPESTWR